MTGANGTRFLSTRKVTPQQIFPSPPPLRVNKVQQRMEENRTHKEPSNPTMNSNHPLISHPKKSLKPIILSTQQKQHPKGYIRQLPRPHSPKERLPPTRVQLPHSIRATIQQILHPDNIENSVEQKHGSDARN